MRLTIGSWFSEPNICFNISHKVDNLIREVIIEDILKPNNLYRESDKDFLSIQVTTKGNITFAYLSDPEIDKKNEMTTYGFWLPYNLIIDSDNELSSYLKYFFIVLKELLLIYGIEPNEIYKVEKKVKLLVLDNTEYKYVKPDDVFDIEDILKGIDIPPE